MKLLIGLLGRFVVVLLLIFEILSWILTIGSWRLR